MPLLIIETQILLACFCCGVLAIHQGDKLQFNTSSKENLRNQTSNEWTEHYTNYNGKFSTFKKELKRSNKLLIYNDTSIITPPIIISSYQIKKKPNVFNISEEYTSFNDQIYVNKSEKVNLKQYKRSSGVGQPLQRERREIDAEKERKPSDRLENGGTRGRNGGKRKRRKLRRLHTVETTEKRRKINLKKSKVSDDPSSILSLVKKTTKGQVEVKRPKNKVRLPSPVVPVHYVLKINTVQEKYEVRGYVSIELEVREATSIIRLHVDEINIVKESIEVRSIKRRTALVPIRTIRLNTRRHFLTVKLRRQLKAGRPYVLIISDFGYPLRQDSTGFYSMLYQREDGTKGFVAATQFWPIHARRAFPCFDEPGMKATFDVHLSRKADMMTLSNMPLVRSAVSSEDSSVIWDQFATTPNISTYLIAFLLSDFESIERIDERRQNVTGIRVWTQKSLLNQTDLAYQSALDALTFFQEYFLHSYPLPKLDMVALPQMIFGGMENWGLITYREASLVYSPGKSPLTKCIDVSVLVAHEVAHQWFGNLVTFYWWNDLWLNEGFATYMSYLALEKEVMEMDSLESSHAINVPIRNPKRINEVFDMIPYNKGAAIIRMMQHFLTEKTFVRGLQYYLQKYQYRNTVQDDLWNCLTRASHEDGSLPAGITVKEIMDTWTLQPGFPVIHVQRKDDGTALLTQQHFQLGVSRSSKNNSSNASGAKSPTWWVPITFTSQRRPSFEHTRAQTWLRAADVHLTVTGLPNNDQWVLFNLQQTGYYRVNYDQRTWQLLIDQLHMDHTVIHVTNRAQIIDDAFNLARTGLISYETTLSLVSYLVKERNFPPWKATIRNLQYINLMLRKTKDYGAFKEFVFSLISPVMSSLRESASEKKNMENILLKSEIKKFNCLLDHFTCLLVAEEAFKDLSVQSYSDYVYCAGIRNSGEHLWNKVLKRLGKSPIEPDFRSALLSSLGCSRRVWLIYRYLEAIKNDRNGLASQHSALMFLSTSKTVVGSYVSWDILRTNWNLYQDNSDVLQYTFPVILSAVCKGFNQQYQVDELQSFYDNLTTKDESVNAKSRSKNNPLLPAVSKALETSKENVEWFKTNYASIVGWLQTQGFSSRISIGPGGEVML